MDMNRKRPPKDCADLGLWLSGTINDAVRDATEAGLSCKEAAYIMLYLARSMANVACMTNKQVRELLHLHHG